MTSNLNSIPNTWRRKSDRMHQMAKKAIFDRFFLAFSSTLECRFGTFRSQKMISKMVGLGCLGQKKIGPFRRIFTPHIPKKKKSTPKSQLALYFEIWHTHFWAVKVHIGRGLRKISGAEKTVIYKKRWVFRLCESIVVVS